jgi:hypothetical protein
MSHTQVQVCKKLDNSISEKNQLISKSLPRTFNTVICLFNRLIIMLGFQVLQF